MLGARPRVLIQDSRRNGTSTFVNHLPVPVEPTQTTLLEHSFPFREISFVIGADRRVRDPVYGLHRWWARRPPALLRSLLIATQLGRDATLEDFWSRFASSDRILAGRRVMDPFAGGGSTLIEAARLGADVEGSDIDPLAVDIVKAELNLPDAAQVTEAANDLLVWLTGEFGRFYPAVATTEALHYFSVPEVECPGCSHRGPLYRNIVLARDRGLPGAVVRDCPMVCFCPRCYRLQHLSDASARSLTCCGELHLIGNGTYRGHLYNCPECGKRSSHRELQTGLARQLLIAVEGTPMDGRRVLRQPTEEDIGAPARARMSLAKRGTTVQRPTGRIHVGHHDERPASYGISFYEDLFTPRQLLVLGSAWWWTTTQDYSEAVDKALKMALSNALATNNRLCGYATDYGRLSPLFSLRGYSLPALAVELNPLHSSGGRGTLRACLDRIIRAARTKSVVRHTWVPSQTSVHAVELDVSKTSSDHHVLECRSADTVSCSGRSNVDVCVFDPPYFDYIAYDELSAFFRAWRPGWGSHLAGAPLLPSDAPSADSFGAYLGRCLRSMVSRLRTGTPITFTYHSKNEMAWEAIATALDESRLAVTALWPIRSDPRMGLHSHPGSSEWDLVIVCRRREETHPTKLLATVDYWAEAVKPLVVSDADRTNLGLGISMAASRFAIRRRTKHA